MSRLFNPADWSPARAGTAIGTIVSAMLPRDSPDGSGRRYLLAQQPWHIRSELLVASIIWSLLPVSLAAALIGRSIESSLARILLLVLVPFVTPILVQCSMFLVGAVTFALRRIGILRHASDGWIQAAVWGAAGTALALLALRRGGVAQWIAFLWLAILALEALCRIIVAVMARRLEAISRSREVRG